MKIMCTLKFFPASGQTTGVLCVALLFGISLVSSPILAETNTDGVPPWQLPPGQGSGFHSASIERTAYQPEMENETEGGVVAHSPHTSDHLVVESEIGGNSWNSCEGGDCDFRYCIDPFSDRLWFRGEALAMFGKAAYMSPLVTTSEPADGGIIGQPTTRPLFGGQFEDPGITAGGRMTLGYRCSPCEDSGLEVIYMFLGDKTLEFNADGGTTPNIARPFYNVQTPAPHSLPVALPGQRSGFINVRLSDEFNTLEMLWRQSITTSSCREVSFLAGYRYAHFGEALTIDSTSNFLVSVPPITQGSVVRFLDRFTAQNDFQGGELGISTKKQYCRWSVEMLAKFALGNTRSTVDIYGETVTTLQPNPPSTSRGGLLAMPTNMTRVTENNFTVIPELGLTLGYDLTERMKVSLGYTFVYWSRVARPSDQIDTNVNTSQAFSQPLTGIPAPLFRYTPSDYWVQGLTLGLDYRF
jgi:hypothetical protein